MNLRMPALLAFTASLSGCAQWVWNERYTDCDGYSEYIVNTWSKPLVFQVAPFFDAEDDEQGCEVRSDGLFQATVGRFDPSLEQYNVGAVRLGHRDAALDVATLAVEWGQCDEDEEGRCGDGRGAVLEVDSVRTGGSGIDGFRLVSQSSGRVALGGDGIDVLCVDCSIRGTLGHEERISVDVLRAGDDGVIDLCFVHAGVVEITLPAGVASPIRLEFATPPARLTLSLPDAEVGPELELVLAPLLEGPYDFRGFGPALPSSNSDHRIELEGSALWDVSTSDGVCSPVEFTWSD